MVTPFDRLGKLNKLAEFVCCKEFLKTSNVIGPIPDELVKW